jgi:hypothetical protein
MDASSTSLNPIANEGQPIRHEADLSNLAELETVTIVRYPKREYFHRPFSLLRLSSDNRKVSARPSQAKRDVNIIPIDDHNKPGSHIQCGIGLEGTHRRFSHDQL